MKEILVVDDEVRMRESLRELLEGEGYRVLLADGAAQALGHLKTGCPDIALVDVRMTGTGGLDLLKQLRQQEPLLPVIMMTGFPSVETAVLAMKFGALDFHSKPLDLAKLTDQLARLTRVPCPGPAAPGPEVGRLLGESPAVRALTDAIRRVAPTDASIVITGESGTGKELVAEAIHGLSRRSAHPFLKINCAAISETLLESELFGHEKGSFTGATTRKVGLFESADRGTLFLDEVGEMEPRLQAKLLRILQGGEFRRVGGTQDLRTDVRILAATNRDLSRMVRDGGFREDLYFRLSVITLQTPPLRDRPGDIPLLVSSFAAEFARAYGRRAPEADPQFLRILQAQPWPGNVRELRNTIERAIIFCDGDRLLPDHLPGQYFLGPKAVPACEPATIQASMEEHERRMILGALEQTGGNRTRAAEVLGIHRRTLYSKLERLGLEGAELSPRTS